MAPSESLDTILNQITTTNNAVALNNSLRNNIPKESRDTILASFLSGGQDPLTVLDMRENTLGVLWILAARLTLPTAAPPPWPLVQEFCHTFIPEHSRLAPDRVTAVARGIAAHATASLNPKAAIQPLYDLVRRYPPDLSYLTSIHTAFALVRPSFLLIVLSQHHQQSCVSTQTFSALVPVLYNPITNIDTVLSPDLTYNDSLIYHYLGGITFAALKRWTQAEEFFEIALSTPGHVPAALQLEALKKLKLVQLIATGKTAPLPKYTHPLLLRLFKSSPYSTFVNAYPHNTDLLHDCVQREAATFAAEKNTGLIQQAFARAPRWTLKKLTGTYVTLSLSDIAKAIKIESEDDVRALLLDMIEANDVTAQISADGAVTFSDPAPTFTKEQVDCVLADVQNQAELLSFLERGMAKSKEYLSKAVKNREDSSWAAQAEEDLLISAPGIVWAEEASFA
ncbi:hypothetical protein C0992_011973 [Termitomyces sp. T32_za158]|nr:hypothetical protein C0992_011973 [Termitomyces sp. T32_za158]